MTPVAEEITLEPAPGLRVRWQTEAVGAYPDAGEALEPAWSLEGALAPAHSALRVLAGATSEGSILLLASARPAGAGAHDAEAVSAAVLDPEGEVTTFAESLLSTEYAGDGSVRRITLELYAEGDEYPLRGAGDAAATESSEEEGVRRESTTLRFRLHGHEGAGLYEILHA